MSVLVRWKLLSCLSRVGGRKVGVRESRSGRGEPTPAFPARAPPAGLLSSRRWVPPSTVPRRRFVFSLWARIAVGMQSNPEFPLRHQVQVVVFAFPKMKINCYRRILSFSSSFLNCESPRGKGRGAPQAAAADPCAWRRGSLEGRRLVGGELAGSNTHPGWGGTLACRKARSISYLTSSHDPLCLDFHNKQAI